MGFGGKGEGRLIAVPTLPLMNGWIYQYRRLVRVSVGLRNPDGTDAADDSVV